MTNENLTQRLTDALKRCVTSYEAWQSRPKDVPTRQQLEEAVHELRKVTARIEIEMAVSERSDRSQKPIPIPAHRASHPKTEKMQKGGNSVAHEAAFEDDDMDDDDHGNSIAEPQGQNQSRSASTLSLGGDDRKSGGGQRRTLKSNMRRKSED